MNEDMNIFAMMCKRKILKYQKNGYLNLQNPLKPCEEFDTQMEIR